MPVALGVVHEKFQRDFLKAMSIMNSFVTDSECPSKGRCAMPAASEVVHAKLKKKDPLEEVFSRSTDDIQKSCMMIFTTHKPCQSSLTTSMNDIVPMMKRVSS